MSSDDACLRSMIRPSLEGLKMSGIAQMVALANSAGPDVIRLEVGDVDLPSPTWLLEGMRQSFEAGTTHYPAFRGDAGLIDALARKLRENEGLDVGAEHLLITAGGSMALFLAFSALVSPGDEVIILEPVWPHLNAMVRFVGGTPVAVSLDPNLRFRPIASQIEDCVSTRTRAVVLNSPTNPSGTVYTRSEVEGIVAVARRHHLAVISDEEYEAFRYRGQSFTTPVELYDLSIAVRSFSKCLSISGLRVGYLIAPPLWIESLSRISLYTTMYCSSLIQRGLALTFEEWSRFSLDVVHVFEERMERTCTALTRIPGIRCEPSQGSLYLWPDCRALCVDDWEFATYLLKSARVAVVPGSVFGLTGRGFLRVSLGAPLERLLEAVDRIGAAVAHWKRP